MEIKLGDTCKAPSTVTGRIAGTKCDKGEDVNEEEEEGARGGGRGREGQEEVRPLLKSTVNVLMASFGENTLIPLAQERLPDSSGGGVP